MASGVNCEMAMNSVPIDAMAAKATMPRQARGPDHANRPDDQRDQRGGQQQIGKQHAGGGGVWSERSAYRPRITA